MDKKQFRDNSLMEPTPLNALWIKRAKKLSLFLFASVFGNIILALALFSKLVTDQDPTQLFEKNNKQHDLGKAGKANKSLSATLSEFSVSSFHELIDELANRAFVEQGYRFCDVALSCLVAYHHFDLHKALGGAYPQSRDVTFAKAQSGETIDIALFPGLTEAQLEAICHFAKTEEWPLTTQGLFHELKNQNKPPQNLLESFYSTAEFQSLYLYLQRAPRPISRKALSELLITSDYKQFERLALRVRKDPLLSADFRFQFYRTYLASPSKIAAYMLLENDESIALEQLLDREINLWLQMIDYVHPKYIALCNKLLTSPRTDDVWRQSAIGLLKAKNLPIPSPYNHSEALRVLFPEATWKPLLQTVANVPPTPTLQEGPHLFPTQERIEPSSSFTIAKTSKEDERVSNARKSDTHRHETLPPRIPYDAPRETKIKSTGSSKERAKAHALHTVQEGESLWKISRKYKVSVERLMEFNQLESEKIKPGRVLKIPQ